MNRIKIKKKKRGFVIFNFISVIDSIHIIHFFLLLINLNNIILKRTIYKNIIYNYMFKYI